MVDLSLAPGAGLEIARPADLDRYLGAVADAGFTHVSLSTGQLAGDPAAAARLLEVHGLSCPDLAALLVGADDAEVAARAADLAAACGELGCRHVLTLFWGRADGAALDRFVGAARRIAPSGARLGLEMPPVGPLNSIPAVLDVLERVAEADGSLVLDSFHFFRGRSTWEDLEGLALDQLGFVQFDDALPAVSEDVMAETMHRRAFPGDGELDLGRFAGTLTGRGWSGVVSVEVLSDDLRSLDPAEFARRAYRASAPYWSAPAARWSEDRP